MNVKEEEEVESDKPIAVDEVTLVVGVSFAKQQKPNVIKRNWFKKLKWLCIYLSVCYLTFIFKLTPINFVYIHRLEI